MSSQSPIKPGLKLLNNLRNYGKRLNLVDPPNGGSEDEKNIARGGLAAIDLSGTAD